MTDIPMTAVPMTRINVEASKKYDVCIGRGLLAEAGFLVAQACGGAGGGSAGRGGACGGGRAFLVSDDIVAKLYGEVVEGSLRGAGYSVQRFVFEHGEASKNMETFTAILSALATGGFTRSDIVVALGGGVTGDMAGFAAAVYLRGVKFVQIPTTLLAMVDSSVGGKTAIDLPVGKNLVGAFYQPDVVICDVDTLGTLPDEIFADGCAEVIKHGVILSFELFELLKAPLSARDARMADIIARNVTIKRDVVVEDEREAGLRKLLNFGHTIGHGVEVLSDYTVSHGRAVAIGMALEMRCAYRAGYCDEGCYSELTGLLERYSLPHCTDFSAEELLEAAFYDKKRSASGISLIIPSTIGKCEVREFSMEELSEFVRAGLDTL